jgi:hypothetical protein
VKVSVCVCVLSSNATVDPSGSGTYSFRTPLRVSAITSPLMTV